MLKNKEKELILSMIVGDGSISKFGEKRYRLYVGHGEKQKDYCQWKMDLLNSSKIFSNVLELHTKITGNEKKFVQYFFSKENIMMKYFYDLCIQNNKKVIWNILPYLKTSLSTAIWFMDDGAVEPNRDKQKDGSFKYYRPGLKLCTHSFSYEENIRIQRWFKHKYHIDCSVKKEKKIVKQNTVEYYFLRFNADNSEKLYKNILRRHIFCCESMKYKFRLFIQQYENI